MSAFQLWYKPTLSSRIHPFWALGCQEYAIYWHFLSSWACTPDLWWDLDHMQLTFTCLPSFTCITDFRNRSPVFCLFGVCFPPKLEINMSFGKINQPIKNPYCESQWCWFIFEITLDFFSLEKLFSYHVWLSHI